MLRRPESVLVLIYTHQGEVLLLQRADMPEFWQSVTGGLEFDELPATAAQRELLEETGIHATDDLVDHHRSEVFEIRGPWRSRYSPEHTHNREHLFSVKLPERVDVVLNASEHLNHVWLTAEQAYVQASSLTNKKAIKDIVLTSAEST